MAGEFWLSEAQWGAIGPLLPKNQPGARRTDDRRVLSGIVHVRKTGCRCGRTARPSTGLRRRSTIAFAAGRCAGSGVGCLTRWRAPIPAMVKPSTARRPRLTARRRAEKGGRGAGDWSFARRPHHENPRHRRRPRTPHRYRSDARPSRRRSSRDSLDHRSSARRLLGRRHRLRTAMVCVGFFSNVARFRSSRTTRPARDFILSTRTLIANAISSSACSAASRIGDASPPATTSSQPTSPPRS
jgi:hypothetical protein